MRPTSHVFRGIKYAIKWRHPRGFNKNVGGACTSPGSKNPTIEISPRARGVEKLCIIIDEAIHAVDWDKDNDAVAECSEAIASLLWKCGYREVVDE